MKGIKQYQADRRRKQRINKVVTPVVDAASIATQVNGMVFGAMGTTRARNATMGVSRMFESKEQRRDADNLETMVLAAGLAIAAGKGIAKGYAKAKAAYEAKAYAKAAAKEEKAEVKVESPLTTPDPAAPKPKRTYTRRAAATSEA